MVTRGDERSKRLGGCLLLILGGHFDRPWTAGLDQGAQLKNVFLGVDAGSGMRALSKQSGLAGITALLVVGCNQSPEQIVTSTKHCTAVTVAPDLMMRLSSFADYPDSVAVWVVQACHPTGTACSPIVTYDHAPPPVYSVTGKTVTVELLGGNLRTHSDKAAFGQYQYAIQTRVITGNVGSNGVEAFTRRVQHRCPSGGQQYPD